MLTLLLYLLAKINNISSYLCCVICFQGAERIFAAIRTQNSVLGFVTFHPAMSSPKQKICILAAFFFHVYFLNYVTVDTGA
jgi:hypothetical protein